MSGIVLAMQVRPGSQGRVQAGGWGWRSSRWLTRPCWMLMDMLLEQPIVLEGVRHISGRLVVASCLSLAVFMNSAVKSQVTGGSKLDGIN